MNIKELADEAAKYSAIMALPTGQSSNELFVEKFAELVAAHEREACAKVVGEAAKKWWSIHCATNKHMETTRKAHDEFCTLQAVIRARGKT